MGFDLLFLALTARSKANPAEKTLFYVSSAIETTNLLADYFQKFILCEEASISLFIYRIKYA
jgi:hypothetical protein